MPYYIGDVIKNEKKLIARTAEQFEGKGVHVRLKTRVEEIDFARNQVAISNSEKLDFDILAIATGSRVLRPDIPGIDSEGVFTLKTLNDAVAIKSYIKEKMCQKAILIGGGVISMELCEALRNLGIETQVMNRGALPFKKWESEFSKMILEEIKNNHVDFRCRQSPQAIEKKNKRGGLCLFTEEGKFEADIIIVATGIKPEIALAEKSGLAIGKTGALQVNFSQQTSNEQVYAVGDCCEAYHRVSKEWGYYPLGDTANKQGRIAGYTIGGVPKTFNGVVGSQCFKVFDLEVAVTGINEQEALKCGYYPVSTIIWGTPTAGVLSFGRKLGLKMIADKSSGKLLGAQAIGHGGAVSRINTLSACLWSEMDIDDIGYLDLAYAPPYGGAWDLVHIAAQSLKRMI